MNYTIVDASNDFSDLSNTLGRFEEELCIKLKIDYESQDFRIAVFNSIHRYLLSLTSYIRAFWDLQQRVSPRDFIKILNIGITAEKFEKANLVYEFPIISLVTMIHFQIDSFFGKLCVLNNKPKKGFYSRMKTVLGDIDITVKKKEDIQNTLQCLAFFRNSFHNHGIHAMHESKWDNNIEPTKGTVDRTFEANDMAIDFKHNETISYNWESVYLLIERSTENIIFLVKTMYLK